MKMASHHGLKNGKDEARNSDLENSSSDDESTKREKKHKRKHKKHKRKRSSSPQEKESRKRSRSGSRGRKVKSGTKVSSKKRSRSRSLSQSRRKSRSPSEHFKKRNKSRSPSKSGKRSKSRSPSQLKRRSKSRSPSKSKKRSKSRSPSKSRKRSKSRSPSKSSQKKSRSRSPVKSSKKRLKSGSPSKTGKRRSRSSSSSISKASCKSKSRSPSKSRKKKDSISPSKAKKKSKSRSPPVSSRRKSRSRSPRKLINKDSMKSRSRSPRSRRSRSNSQSRISHRARSRSPKRPIWRGRPPGRYYGIRRSRSRSRSDRIGSSSRSRRSRSPDRYRKRSRSCQRSQSIDKSRRHSGSPGRSVSRSKRSKSKDRFDDRKSRSKSKEKSPEKKSVKISVIGQPSTNKDVQDGKDNKTVGGKTVADFTEFCKQLVEEKEEVCENGEDEEKEEVQEMELEQNYHPFKVSEAPQIFIPPVLFPTRAPPSCADIKNYLKPLEEQFPVSCGTEHRVKESNTNQPVSNVQNVLINNVPETPQLLIPQQPSAAFVSQLPESQKIDISDLVVKRLEAQRRIQINPHDVEAMLTLQEIQHKMEGWCKSNLKPGQFTGDLAKSLLPKEDLHSGIQAWAKKDMFHNLAPLKSGIGMKLLQKMGWKPGMVLGKRGEGNSEPIAVDIKVDRKGLSSMGEKTGGKRNVATTVDVEGKHPVSALMELCSKRKWTPPEYNLVHDSGPDHKRNFLMKVVVNNVCYQPRVASNNKKHAKAQAALTVLQALGLAPQS